ncbi:pleckstrin-2 [Exaiptasia diaphana]|uniref:Pleckstrin n=1 Tax=Exaiptasia diaphana TaxID=2652724 RepID=A0A913YQ43_EXADI|nr:pleckstrin-2 [Exaiptasia diaphana]
MDSLSRVKRKEGYLVKKGHVRHNWKTRWFVLYDERLSYYKKKGDKEPVGYVLLQGCFLVSPCTEYTKKESVFRLTSKEGIEYLIQAVNNEERDIWSSAIAECIRKLEARDRKLKATADSKRLSQVHKRESYKESISKIRDIIDAMQDPNAGVPLDNHYCKPENRTHKLCFTGIQIVDWLLKWSFIEDRDEGVGLCNILLEEADILDIIDAMQDPNAGVPLDNHYCKPENRTHKLCFTGIQIVDWLLKWSFIEDRDEGVGLCNILLEEAHIQPVGMTSKNSFRRNRKDSRQMFIDETDALYRFSALRFSSTQDVLDFDSSDESSDSDEEPVKIPGGVIKGTIVKQGFLEKKGHLRHNWKTRKFILCRDPPTLYYCKPSKGDLPVGQLKLEKCEVKSVKKDDDCVTDPGLDPQQTQKYAMMLRTRKGVKYILRAGSEMDQLEWIESLQSVCDEPNND